MSLRLSRVRTALLLCRSTTTTSSTSTTTATPRRHHDTPGLSFPAAAAAAAAAAASPSTPASSPPTSLLCPREARAQPPPPLPRDHPTALARRIDAAGQKRTTRSELRALLQECLGCPLLYCVPADAAEARQLMDLLASVFRVVDHAAADGALIRTVRRAAAASAGSSSALGGGARPPSAACAPLRARLTLLRVLDGETSGDPPVEELRAVLAAAAPGRERDRTDVLSLGGLTALRVVLANTMSEALAHLAAWDALVRADAEGERLLAGFPRDRTVRHFEAAASALDPLEHALVRCRDYGDAGTAETLLARAGTASFLPALVVHPRHCSAVFDLFAAAGNLEGLRRTRARLLHAERRCGVPACAPEGTLGYVRACLRVGSDAALSEALAEAARGHRWQAEAFAAYAGAVQAELEARGRRRRERLGEEEEEETAARRSGLWRGAEELIQRVQPGTPPLPATPARVLRVRARREGHEDAVVTLAGVAADSLSAPLEEAVRGLRSSL